MLAALRTKCRAGPAKAGRGRALDRPSTVGASRLLLGPRALLAFLRAFLNSHMNNQLFLTRLPRDIFFNLCRCPLNHLMGVSLKAFIAVLKAALSKAGRFPVIDAKTGNAI